MKKQLLILCALLLGIMSYAQTTTETFDSGAGVFYVPCGVTSITVEAWGGGGRGGKRTTAGQGGGGGGGAYVRTENIPVSTGDSFNYKVGVGGGTLGNNYIIDGGDTWFNSATFLMAKGGKGVPDNSATGAAGGLATGPIGSGSIGLVKFSGGKGGNKRDYWAGDKAGGGGGAGHYNGNGGDATNSDNGGGTSVTPGGRGADGGGIGFGIGNDGKNYGGGGGGAISRAGIDYEGGKGGSGHIRITYTVPDGTELKIEKVGTISQSKTTDLSCSKTTVNLTAADGNIGAGVSTLWYNDQGTCPSFAYVNEFMQKKYDTNEINNTTYGTLSFGNRQFTSTTDDPGINMLNVLTSPIDPAIYKYMIIRYKIISGTGGEVQIYYNKNGLSENHRVNGTLISDNSWHIMTIDMTSRAGWNNDDHNITGWRFDYATNSGVTIDLDYIMLSNVPILENTNADDTKITRDLTDASASKSIAAVRVADQQALCNNKVPATGCTSVMVDRIDRTFQASGGNWSVSSNWTPTAIPNLNTCVNIPNGTSVIVDNVFGQAGNLMVQNNGELIVPASNLLTVNGSITNHQSDGKNFIVKSDANLIQLSNAANTGKITVERNVNDMNNVSTKMDYVYWSSPVAGQKTKGTDGFSPGTLSSRFFDYRESNDRFYQTYDPVFTAGKGYAVGAETLLDPRTNLPYENGYNKDYQFIGTPHNGDYSIPITRSPDTNGYQHGYNLVGNPYPSNINFNVLFEANKTVIHNTVWFWKNIDFTPTQAGSAYEGNNYVVYNGTGGQTIAENGIIKVGQGFLVQSSGVQNTSVDLTFKNSHLGLPMRVADSGTFYQRNNEGKNRFWLKLISPDDVENTQLIGYIEGATDGFEMDYDAEVFGLSSNLFYSLLDNKRLVIQGKANQFTNEDRVNLGANFFKNGNYTIEVEQPEGIFENGQTIYLKDKLTGTITNLSQGSYTFEANKGVTEGRFEIIYKPETVLVTDNKVKGGIVVYRDSDNFVVQAPKIIANVEVYDLSGKLITVLKSNTNQAVLNASFFNKGMYVLRIKTIDGEITNKKIMK